MAQQAQSLGTVLLTRPLEDSNRVTPDFESLGFEVIISPVIEIKLFSHQLPAYDAICLSSKNALHALKGAPKDTPLFCVGTYTEHSLMGHGFNNITSAPTAKDLLPLLKGVSEHILYLAGTVASLDFSKNLPNCTKHICYEALPIATLNPEIMTTAITHIPLYSARSAELLIKLLTKSKVNLNNAIFLALSEEVAKKAQEADIKKILVASTPTHQGILNLLCEAR